MLYIRSRLKPGFVAPCLPHPSQEPPPGTGWIHEIKHDGYRVMARRDQVGIRLLTRRGVDWADRFPLVVETVNHLKVRSCLIDGEVVCCNERGVAAFHVLRHRRNEAGAFLYASDPPRDPPVADTICDCPRIYATTRPTRHEVSLR